MSFLGRYISFFCQDNRSASEQARERLFIRSVNGLQTLRVTPDGGMSIDAEEIREQVIAARHALKQFVR